MRRVLLLAAPVLALSLAATACSGRTETVVVAAGGTGGTAGGAGGGAGAAGSAGGGGLVAFCPAGPGPEMVAIQTPTGWYCMDSTEVSEDHYATFIDTSPATAGQPEVCAWNDTYVGFNVEPYERSDRPRTWIDWCDARAYCAWAGKRLCGATSKEEARCQDDGAYPRSSGNKDIGFRCCADAIPPG
jgi:hypothetical protein